jgi:hypothetical protein
MIFLPRLLFAMAMTVTATIAHAEVGEVFKSPTCGCCIKWVAHMTESGFALNEKNVTPGELSRIKTAAGVDARYAACHTAKIGGYVVEGHVPAEDVKRLLAEKPDAIGLAVPGMPLGSPGMEAGGATEPYEVLLLKKDGSSEVFARH